ncbi:hypothetical protein DSO57_1020511 [Entomophthora muscae]|uniref:Uncharacterized protein n=2 Tax=Entomophthora muscae TaxID=34485 RepID=A0ACC2RIF5_9FUNG|nr:hypothetical protein DSO57_1020511 [Entomophthora muscae]
MATPASTMSNLNTESRAMSKFHEAIRSNPLTPEEKNSFVLARNYFQAKISFWQTVGAAVSIVICMTPLSKRVGTIGLFSAPIQGAAFGIVVGTYGGYKIIKQIPDQEKIARIFKDFKFSTADISLIGYLGRPLSEKEAPKSASKPISQKEAPIKARMPIIEEEEEEEEYSDDFNYKLYGNDASAWDNVRNASFSKQSSWERVRQRESITGSFNPFQVQESQLGRWEQIREENKVNNPTLVAPGANSSISLSAIGQRDSDSHNTGGSFRKNKYGDII